MIFLGFYSLIHLPREEQAELMKRIWGRLKDDRLVLVNLALFGGEESLKNDWLGGGKGMFWSVWDEKCNVKMIKTAGFGILEAWSLTTRMTVERCHSCGC